MTLTLDELKDMLGGDIINARIGPVLKTKTSIIIEGCDELLFRVFTKNKMFDYYEMWGIADSDEIETLDKFYSYFKENEEYFVSTDWEQNPVWDISHLGLED